VLKALQRDPEQRFLDLDDFAAALMTFAPARTWVTWGRELVSADDARELDERSPRTAAPSQPAPSPRPSAAPQASLRGLPVAFALGALSSAVAFWLWTHRPQPARDAPRPAQTAEETASARTSQSAVSVPSGQSPPTRAPDASLTPGFSVGSPRRPLLTKTPKTAATAPPAPIELGPNDAPILK
jgi:hypothetical protein